jgi:type IV pilus assembly protein PilY1
MKHTTALIFGLLAASQAVQADTNIDQVPLFVSESVPPLNMLVMGRDHKLFYEAYNDASDLNGDGVLDVGYKGYLSADNGGIDYYGYFNSNVCYTYTGGIFVPSSVANNKMCSGKWSGDFLNYLATSRMDALRKVLYGGYRVEDTAGSTNTPAKTVLEAAFVPQDAHTWGKEYQSLSKDGYRITDYTPLNQPTNGYRHLFAVVSLTDGGVPQLRTLTNTTFRIWNWVSKERPVAGDACDGGACTSRGPSGGWSIVPATVLSNLYLTTWRDTDSAPNNESEMNSRFNNPKNECGNGTPGFTNINTVTDFVNPYSSNKCKSNQNQDNYITQITGKLTPTETGMYQFSVDGDDAVDVKLNGTVIASYYGAHAKQGSGGAGSPSNDRALTAGVTYDIEFRHKEVSGGSSFFLYWKTPDTGVSTLTNANIKVEVCPTDATLREDNCVAYANGAKPTGILHDYGSADKMFFGLTSGSFQNNMSGGVLRRQLGSFTKEFNASTGQFCSSSNSNCASDSIANGIVDTINKFRIIDFKYSNQSYGCGWIAGRAMQQSDNCYMWGNPVAEMMYETMRYFSGATAPTSSYKYSSSAVDAKSPLNLPVVDTWLPPYKTTTATNGGYEKCAVPVMTVISDINPSYDGDVPGSAWSNAVTGAGDPASLSGLNVSTEADKVWAKEGGGSRKVFIGASTVSNEDGAPTEKTVTNLSTVRGLAPEEPSKQGTYYSAALANFGANNPIGGDKNLQTYAVALASPLPTIKFPVGKSADGTTQSVTVVPFAKSVGGAYGISATSNFQPTDQIVDYYVETIVNTDANCPAAGKDCDASVNNGRPYAKFRINYEDVEQGADHDMDAIVLYELLLDANGKLVINLTSEYAAGSIDQHMGYVISGTTKDGIYLDVKDQGGANVAYKLDTPPGYDAGVCAKSGANCPTLSNLTSSRTFTPTGASANFLEGPLWYAAKYGTDGSPDVDNDGVPDNYFLVTNALTLKAQLDKAFNDITQKNSSVSSPTVEVPRDSTTTDDAFVYRTDFNIDGWTGDLIKEKQTEVSGQLVKETVWNAASKIPSTRKIYMADSSQTTKLGDFTWDRLANKSFETIDFQTALNKDGITGTVDNYGRARVKYIKGESCATETGCSTFRVRSTKLGDIVNSSPVLVKGAQYLAYRAGALDGDASTYAAFQASVKNRTPMIYVGANDGMLHAFNADTGAEVFAFIPTAVINNLNKLTSPEYGGTDGVHQYFVDGTPTIADVYYGNAWHTVLVGSLGAGGREVFALDITDPSAPKLLWEFTSDGHNNMGYSIPKPIITRLNSGQWAAVFANGYNSANNNNGRAVLFLKDIETGAVIKNLTAQGEAYTNGLSSVRTADFNADGITDYVYAGDLQGNMWRFDLYDTSASAPFDKCTSSCSGISNRFRVSFGGAPLYVAKDGSTSSAKRQPITSAPTLARHPTSVGYLVTFGTGSYLNSNDKISNDTQTVYGIWDRNTVGQNVSSMPSLDRSNLQQQTMTEKSMSVDGTPTAVRVLSDNSISWYNDGATSTSDSDVKTWGWYLDLKASGVAKGERVVANMTLYGDGLIFSTITPNPDTCAAGLDGFTYGINPTTGQRTLYNVFDMNGDGKVNANDSLNGDVVSGHETPAGGTSINDGLQYHTDGSSTAIAAGSNSSGRQLWRVQPENQP